MKQPFKKILFGFAFSPSLGANLAEAVRLSQFFDAELHLVHVGEKTSAKEQELEHLLQEQKITEAPNIHLFWKQGKPVHTLLETIRENQIDLLLIGALKRENVLRYYSGSIARKITRKAKCSVLLISNPSITRKACEHIVVNGLENPKTEQTIATAFSVSQALGCNKITLVEEISPSEVNPVEDDRSLRRATLKKEQINRRENSRVKTLVQKLEKDLIQNIQWTTQSIFGSRGYSIGHYARVVRADLLIMNAENNSSYFRRIIPRDLEHILAELPTDVLIVNPNAYA